MWPVVVARRVPVRQRVLAGADAVREPFRVAVEDSLSRALAREQAESVGFVVVHLASSDDYRK